MPVAEQKHFTASQAANKQHMYEHLKDKGGEVTRSCISFRGLVWLGLLFFFLIPYWIGLYTIAQWVFNVLS
jgi:hypothetical protein